MAFTLQTKTASYAQQNLGNRIRPVSATLHGSTATEFPNLSIFLNLAQSIIFFAAKAIDRAQTGKDSVASTEDGGAYLFASAGG